MRTLVVLTTLLFIVDGIVFKDDSGSRGNSHESSYYFGGRRGGNHEGYYGGRPPVTTKPKTKCEGGWTRVNRMSGGWCVKVFVGMTNQPNADAFCAQHGAKLSAVESQEERETIAELGKDMMASSSGWKIGTLRTGIRRDAFNSPFYSTDGNAQNLNGIKWGGGEPHQGNYGGGATNCAMIWLWAPGGKPDPKVGHGEFFAMVCHMSWNDKFRGYVCGKPAV